MAVSNSDGYQFSVDHGFSAPNDTHHIYEGLRASNYYDELQQEWERRLAMIENVKYPPVVGDRR